MLKFKSFLFGILFITFFVASCDKEEEVVVNEAEVLVEYLESADSPLGKDYVNTDLAAIITATDVHTLNVTDQIYIIDIRSAADFAVGHIENAVNVTFANLLNHIEGVDLTPYTKVAIACYTGQTACYATTLLRLMGYSKVYALKFGMASWHADFAALWNNAKSNLYATQFVTTSTAKGEKGELPVLETGKTTGEEILETRINEAFTIGFSDATKVSSTTLFAGLSNYYIVNYWPAAQYADPGHVPGAIQYEPKQTLKLSVDLKTLPTDKPIAVYCYTGQGSAALVAYLRLLGYDAKTVMFGANGMIYDIMVGKSMSTFKESDIMGYDYE